MLLLLLVLWRLPGISSTNNMLLLLMLPGISTIDNMLLLLRLPTVGTTRRGILWAFMTLGTKRSLQNTMTQNRINKTGE